MRLICGSHHLLFLILNLVKLSKSQNEAVNEISTKNNDEDITYDYYSDEELPGLRRRRNRNKSKTNAFLADLLGFVNSNKNKKPKPASKPVVSSISKQNQYPDEIDPDKPIKITTTTTSAPETTTTPTAKPADREISSENKEVKPKPLSSNFKNKIKDNCIDLFWDFTQNIELYKSLPNYGESITNYAPLEFDYFSGVHYSNETFKACSGRDSKHGSLCQLKCPDGGEFKNIPPRAITKDKKKFKFGERPSHHQEFICKCSGDVTVGQLCFWEMQEARWVSPLTCDLYLVNQWPVYRRKNVGKWWTNVLLQKIDQNYIFLFLTA